MADPSTTRWAVIEKKAARARERMEHWENEAEANPTPHKKGMATRFRKQSAQLDNALETLNAVTGHRENRMNARGDHDWPRCEDCLNDLTVAEIELANPALICNADRKERADMKPRDRAFFELLREIGESPEKFGLHNMAQPAPPAQPVQPTLPVETTKAVASSDLDAETIEKARKYDELVALGLLEQLGIIE